MKLQPADYGYEKVSQLLRALPGLHVETDHARGGGWIAREGNDIQRGPSSADPTGERASGVIKTKADKETYGEKGYGERKYACGLIVPDDGSPEIFYMSRGDAGALLRVGQRVTYVPAVNRQGPIAHHVKPAELVEADRPRPARRRGTVTAVKPAESPTYGFVRPDAGGDDVFVAFGDVVRGTLAAGDRVEYELVPNEVRGDGVKGGNVVVLPARTPAAAPAPRSVPADARTAVLEAENEGLRDENARLTGEVSKLRRALRHAANMIDALGGAPSGDVGVDS